MKGSLDHYDDTNDSLGYLVMGLFSKDLQKSTKVTKRKTTQFYG